MNLQDIKTIDTQYVLHTYKRADVAFKKGKNATLYDEAGRDYIDFGAGIGVVSVGHGNKALAKAINKAAKRLIHTSNLYHIAPQARLAKKIIDCYTKNSRSNTKYRVFFSNSGAEANECAIKIARKFGNPSGRYKIITLDSSFHGRTIASLKATGQDKMHKHFGPYPDGFVYAKDIKDIANVLDSQTCAVLLELVQGEGGIEQMDKAQVIELAKLLKSKNVLLMVDEVQSGIYRSGEIFASKIYGIEPDVITMAKGLAGGVPIGACMTSRVDIFAPSEHGSTFGGNFLSTSAGLRAIKILEKAYDSGKLKRTIVYFNAKLDSLLKKYPTLFIHKTGLGLMCGLKAKSEQIQQDILQACFTQRLLVLRSGRGVVRFLPPLLISKREIDEGFRRFQKALKSIKTKNQTPKTTNAPASLASSVKPKSRTNAKPKKPRTTTI